MPKFIFITILVTLLTACAPQTEMPVSAPTPPTVQTNDFAPRPADGGLTRDQVFLNSINLLTQESHPLQFSLSLNGSLPTPCHSLRVNVNPPDANHKIVVEAYSVTKPDAICAQMLKLFEVSIPLGSYPSGHYFLIVNGKQIAEFDS